MRLSLDVRIEAVSRPEGEARELVEALIRECRDADGYDPRLRFDTHLNADRGMPAWLLAWACPPGCACGHSPNASADPSEHRRLLVGAASAFAPSRDEGEIRACVAPLFRRQGIFKLLYRGLEARLRHSGAESVLVVCEEASPSGAAIAGRLGASLDHREILMRLPEGALAAVASNGRVRLVPVTRELVDQEAAASQAVFCGALSDARVFCEASLDDPAREAFLAMAAEGQVGLLAFASMATTGEGIGARGGEAQGGPSLRKRAIIYGLGIVPSFRRRGYGRDTLLACLEVLRRRGIDEVCLEVEADNAAALALYRQIGFAEHSRAAYWRLSGARG